MTPRIQEQYSSTSTTRTTAAPLAPTQAVTHRFPRHRRSVGRARAALRHQLAVWHVVGQTADSAVLLLSELTTNAVKATTTPGREIGVRFELNGTELRLEVSDTSGEQPTLKHATTDDETGRGLLLVDALADRWGVEPRDGVGKVVWARLVVLGNASDAEEGQSDEDSSTTATIAEGTSRDGRTQGWADRL